EVLRVLRQRVPCPTWRCYELTREIYDEIRSTRERIAVLLSKRRDRFRVPIVFCASTTPHLPGRSLLDDCNKDISRLCAKFPWASLGDLDLYVEGWSKGAEWGLTKGRDSSYSYSEPRVANTVR